MDFKKLTLACLITSALTACGGGGGSTSGGSAPVVQGGPSHSVGGVASKGTIKNGIVSIYAYDAAGNRSAAPVATGRTSAADGSYSLDLGGRTGLFLIEVGADAGTTMDDEYSGTIAMPPAMTMRSLVQIDAGTDSVATGHVTPFTDMLVAAALSASPTGALTADNVANAQSGVTRMLGFNPLTTRPLNANSDAAAGTTDASEKLQSVALAAISQIAHDSGMGCGGSAGEKVNCAVRATTGSATMKSGAVSISADAADSLQAALASTVQDSAVNKTTLKTLEGQQLFSSATRVVSGAPAVVVVQQSDVAATKALFASLRTNLQAWSTSSKDGGGLRNSLDSMQADFNNAVSPLDQSLADWMLLSGRGIKLLNDYAQSKSTDISFSDGDDESALGSCALYKDTAGTVAMTYDDVGHATPQSVSCAINGATVAGSETVTGSGTYQRTQIIRTMVLTPTGSGNSSSFNYTAQTLRSKQQYQKSFWGAIFAVSALDHGVAIGDAATGKIAYTMKGNALGSTAISGNMPARVDDSGNALTDHEAWNLSFTGTTDTSGATRYSFSGHIDALKNGASLGAVDLYNTSYVRVLTAAGKQRVIEAKLAVGVTAGGSTVKGTLALSKYGTDKNGARYLPTYAQFTGSFTNARNENFNGTLTAQVLNYQSYDSAAPLSPSNFVTGNAAFNGSLTIASRPTLTVTFSASSIGYQSDTFNASYYDGSNFILFSGDNSVPHMVKISSGTGVSVALVDGASFINVYKNNNKVALLNMGTRIINYSDGSFETFN